MNRKPDRGENCIVGKWVETEDGSVVQDSACDRVQWLTESYFEQIAVDGDNWCALYRDPDDGSYWELTYPQSHMHGGGPPALNRISESVALEKYGRT